MLMGLFAPELRSWNRNSLVIFSFVGLVTAALFVSFTPVWMALRWLRIRSRRGLTIRATDYVFLAAAFVSSLGIFVALSFAISVVVR